MVHMHRKRPRRQAEVTHDVSLDIRRRQLRPSASNHNDQSAPKRDLIRRNLHRARDDARLRPRPSGRVAQRRRRGGVGGETTIRAPTRLSTRGRGRGLCAADRRSRLAPTTRPRRRVLRSTCRQTPPAQARARPSSTATDTIPTRRTSSWVPRLERRGRGSTRRVRRRGRSPTR
jgi:hypothetical protein